MKRFLVPIGLVVYIIALIFYNPPISIKPPIVFSYSTSDTFLLELDASEWEVIIPKYLFNESPCVDIALSILSILERYDRLNESIQLIVSTDHVQVIELIDNTMVFLSLGNGMHINFSKNEFPEATKLVFFGVNDFRLAVSLLPYEFTLDMLVSVVNNLNNRTISTK